MITRCRIFSNLFIFIPKSNLITEAAIQLVINDFSKLIDKNKLNFNKLNIYSERCKLCNFEWSIYICLKMNSYNKISLGFFLSCNSIENLSKFPIKVKTDFLILHKSAPLFNLTKK